MKDLSDFAGLIIAAVVVIVQLLVKAREARDAAPAPKPEKRPRAKKPQKPQRAPASPASEPDRAARARAAAKRADDARRKVRDRIDDLDRRAAELAAAARVERSSRRFVDALATYVPREAARVRDALLRGGDARAAAQEAGRLDLVLVEIEALIRQRRDPVLRPELGDADAFADACYAPVIAFARAEGLLLRSGTPATQLADFDISIWTGFIPTSIAPIFLPPDFFTSALRWPALAHEIGHDFLASVDGLEDGLRRELALPSVDLGTRPLPFGGDLTLSDFFRVFGAWFEEIFCDVFGTLMCGPAYVVTMSELFAARGDPRASLLVLTDETGARYDVHPPAHLRVLVGCAVLDRAGFSEDARALRAAWELRHDDGVNRLDRLLFPMGRVFVALPLEPFAELARSIVERLYAGPLAPLSGFGLQDVSGLDYGPHEHMEALRARDALLGGRAPEVRDPRAIISGAVLAAQARPELEVRILAGARAAIPAVGTGEARPDAFTIAAAGAAASAGAIETDRQAVIEALVLREILGPPRALRGRQRRVGL